MGEQPTPTSAVTLCTTMPRRPRSGATDGLSACCRELQHWMGPVLHWLACGVGVATARRAREEVNTSFLNIVDGLVAELRAAEFD